MKSSEPKKDGALPAGDLNRLAQRDIGKVARLFRESGFRYRVFDAETGEHQMVDPVRPLPPLDHVPPVWPPPLNAEASVPRAAAGVTLTRATEVAPARVEIRAAAATARAEEIFRSVADGSALPAGAVATPRPTPTPAPPSSVAPTPPVVHRHAPLPASAPAPAPRRAMRPTPVSPAAPPPMDVAAPVSAVFDVGIAAIAVEMQVEPTVGAIFASLFQPPATPAQRDTDSTANVLGGLLGKFPER